MLSRANYHQGGNVLCKYTRYHKLLSLLLIMLNNNDDISRRYCSSCRSRTIFLPILQTLKPQSSSSLTVKAARPSSRLRFRFIPRKFYPSIPQTRTFHSSHPIVRFRSIDLSARAPQQVAVERNFPPRTSPKSKNHPDDVPRRFTIRLAAARGRENWARKKRTPRMCAGENRMQLSLCCAFDPEVD